VNSLLIGITVFGFTLTASSEILAETTKDDSSAQQLQSPEVDRAIVGKYIHQMTRGIRANLNPGLCPLSNPELTLEVRLTEDGNLSDVPKFITRSNNSNCDDAVVRAIYAAKPFAMPLDHPTELKRMTEPMLLKIKPRG
jgi:colicin import membrane protein